MKQIYKTLKDIRARIIGNCDIHVETSYNIGNGVLIGVKWCPWSEYTVGTMEQYFSEEELNKSDSKKLIDRFIKEANEFYHKNHRYTK
jgi:hypothetical protein